MKNLIITALIATAASASAQSFVAGWDFDNAGAADLSSTANWGAQSGSALASWTHSPANPPIVFTSEFGLDALNNSDVVNNSFTFLATGQDPATGFTGFDGNDIPSTVKAGFQSFTADDSFTLSFDGSLWQDLELTYAFASSQGGVFSVQTVDLSSFDGVAAADYVFTPALNGVYDNFAITGTAVPEPSSYAAIFGVIAIAFVASRRRK